MAETSNVLREVRAAASNSLSLFSDDIVGNFLKDMDEEALAELSDSGESSDQAMMVFKQADNAYIQQLVDKNTKQTTQTWIRRFDAWRAGRGISNPLHETQEKT